MFVGTPTHWRPSTKPASRGCGSRTGRGRGWSYLSPRPGRHRCPLKETRRPHGKIWLVSSVQSGYCLYCPVRKIMLSNTVDVIYYFSLIKDEIKLKDIMNMVIKMNTLVYRNASILQALFLFSYFEVHYIIFQICVSFIKITRSFHSWPCCGI